MRKKIIGAAVAALFFSAPAEAVNWVKVVTSKDGLNTMWVDSDRIIRGEESTMIWTRLSLSKGNYVVTLTAVRCASHTYMDLKRVVFSPSGTSTELDVKNKWEIGIPDTVMDTAINYVCESE